MFTLQQIGNVILSFSAAPISVGMCCVVLCTCMKSEEKHIKLNYLLTPNSCGNNMKLHLISMYNSSSCNSRWNNGICLSNFPAAYDNFKLINNNYYRSGITSTNSAHPRPLYLSMYSHLYRFVVFEGLIIVLHINALFHCIHLPDFVNFPHERWWTTIFIERLQFVCLMCAQLLRDILYVIIYGCTLFLRKNQKSNNLVKSTAVKAATGKPNQMRTNFIL